MSTRQEAMLKELRDQNARIEQLSKAEHDLIREVHPKVEEISDDVSKVAAAVHSGSREGQCWK